MRQSLRLAACGMLLLLSEVVAVAQQVGEEAPELLIPKEKVRAVRKREDAISLFEVLPKRIVVLYYWSSLDSKSVDFFATLDAIEEKYGPRGVTVFGLTRQQEDTLKKVFKEKMPHFPSFYGVDFGYAWRFPAPRTTYIIDPYRRIAFARFDPTDPRENLEEKLEIVLAKTPTLAASDEVLKRNTQRLLDLIAKEDFGRAYTLAKAFKGFFRDKEDADQEEQTDEMLRQISLGAQRQLEAARADLDAQRNEEAASKLAVLSVRMEDLNVDNEKGKGKSKSKRSAQAPKSKGKGGSKVEAGKDFREIKEDVEREIGKMESDNYTKAIILKAIDNARAEVRNDEAAEYLGAGLYAEARRTYASVVEDYAETAAAQSAQEALDRIEKDSEMKKAIVKGDAAEQAERWYDLANRFCAVEMFDKGREFFEKLIKEYPDSTEAKNARDRLARLSDEEQAAREGQQRREKVAPSRDNAKTVEQARAILQKLIDEDYKGFLAGGDDKLRQSLDEQSLRQTWADLQKKVGKFKSVEEGKVSLNGVTFLAQFERGTRTLRIMLDSQSRMTGFWVD